MPPPYHNNLFQRPYSKGMLILWLPYRAEKVKKTVMHLLLALDPTILSISSTGTRKQ